MVRRVVIAVLLTVAPVVALAARVSAGSNWEAPVLPHHPHHH